jgi:hypothetical protein
LMVRHIWVGRRAMSHDIRRIIRNVRLPLDSGHWPDIARCLLSARSGHHQNYRPVEIQ